jgi:outer membrane protein OmpA-like peptidoglycan-associated protein
VNPESLDLPRVAVLCATLAALDVPLATQPTEAPLVPLREGLIIVNAYRTAAVAGDFESITTITHVDAAGITLALSTDEPGCGGRGLRSERVHSWGLRIVLREDLEQAHTFRTEFAACPSRPDLKRGATAIGVSASVLRELKAQGRTNLSATTYVAGLLPGVLTRIERGTVPLKVIVNDKPAELPVVHARWQSSVGDRDYWILDDGANPLVLRGTYNGQPFTTVVRLSYPPDRNVDARPIVRDLEKTGRAVVYGISFDFGSDRIKDESDATLAEIARALQQNPSWTVAVEGHTDNVGGEAYNLDLSKRRAAAVKQALVARYKIDGSRLRWNGYGASRPKDSNDTFEGRARNRRVELIRIG